MNFEIFSFRNAQIIFENDSKYKTLWEEITTTLKSITDEDIILEFNSSNRTSKKSVSDAINKLIDKKLVELNWQRQSAIFNHSEYRPTSRNHTWTLDFAKEEIAIEVAFNHGGNTAWNLIKPVLSSELNHVEKAIQTSAGVIITAKDSMKRAGNFDNAIGSYEKFLQYLKPFSNILTVPLIIIGLDAPTTFKINPISRQVEYLNT